MASFLVEIKKSFGIYSAISVVQLTSLKVPLFLLRPHLKNAKS